MDIAINGSFWLGAAIGAMLTVPLLDPKVVDPGLGWRVAFGLGVVLAIVILFVRKNVPESPRWLFIHGKEGEAEEIVRDVESQVAEQTGEAGEKTKDMTALAPGYYLGAALMIAGGVLEIFLGVHAEGESLEDTAKPLTAEDAEREEPATA